MDNPLFMIQAWLAICNRYLLAMRYQRIRRKIASDVHLIMAIDERLKRDKYATEPMVLSSGYTTQPDAVTSLYLSEKGHIHAS